MLDCAIEECCKYLLSSFSLNGRLLGGCLGRPLETALTLRLLREVNRSPEIQARCTEYCSQYLQQATRLQLFNPDDPRAINQLISTIAACYATNTPIPQHHCDAIETLFPSFEHPARVRKAVLFTTILYELEVPVNNNYIIAPETPYAPEHHLWSCLMLIAIRILQAKKENALANIHGSEYAFLLKHQSSDGSWEHHLLLTIFILLALHRANAGDDAKERGMAALLNYIRPDGSVPFITDEDIWLSALSGYVLAEAGVPDSQLCNVGQYLLALQSRDGGWSYTEEVSQSDADTTSLAMLFLSRLGQEPYKAALGKGADYLLTLFNDEAGVPTFVQGAAADVEITAKVLRALFAADRLDAALEQRTLRWLALQQSCDGSFRAEWKISANYPAFHVMALLSELKKTALTKNVSERIFNWLCYYQHEDGGWGIVPQSTHSHILSSAYALSSLAYAGVTQYAAFSRGLEFLISKQLSDGSFEAEGDSLGPRPLIYNVPILASIYCLWALVQAKKALYFHNPAICSFRKNLIRN